MPKGKYYQIFLTLVVSIMLAGCGQGFSQTIPPTPTSARLIPTNGIGVAQVRATCEQSATEQPGKSQVLEQPDDTETPTALGMIGPCSPLKDHLLDELAEIISDGYHPPPMGKDQRHQGVDFSYYRRGERMSIQGVEIQSVFPGIVSAAMSDSFPFGNMIMIETPEDYLSTELRQQIELKEGESLYILYAHMGQAPGLSLGDVVQRCQSMGQVGKSGNAGVAHLHLEMRRGPAGAQFPVLGYYLAKNTAEERANYLRWATSGEFLHFNPMDLLLPGG